MEEIDFATPQGAIFSEDRRYRYGLWRVWSTSIKPLLFIGLNPSTAGSIKNDPTITRLMTRAEEAGFGGLLAANLYALVSTDPHVLLKNDDAVGAETDAYLHRLLQLSGGKALCGWGSFPAAKHRRYAVLAMIPEPYCLGINRDGQPTHPLYIGYDVKMVKMS